ncbi:unnamed protein product, partial [Durusdinium trenchii]
HQAFCCYALRHWRRHCERLAQQLRIEAMRSALLHWQDLTLTERLSIRFTAARALIPHDAAGSPTSAPKLQASRGSGASRGASARQAKVLETAQRAAWGALQLRRTLRAAVGRRRRATLAAWRNFILPGPMQLMLAHVRGPCPSLQWRMLSTRNTDRDWLLKREEDKVKSSTHPPTRAAVQSARLLAAVLGVALRRRWQSAFGSWRTTAGWPGVSGEMNLMSA